MFSGAEGPGRGSHAAGLLLLLAVLLQAEELANYTPAVALEVHNHAAGLLL
jgi:hypothetical protein